MTLLTSTLIVLNSGPDPSDARDQPKGHHRDEHDELRLHVGQDIQVMWLEEQEANRKQAHQSSRQRRKAPGGSQQTRKRQEEHSEDQRRRENDPENEQRKD